MGSKKVERVIKYDDFTNDGEPDGLVGVYMIEAKRKSDGKNACLYVGSSLDVKYRVRQQHEPALLRGNHENKKLQKWFNILQLRGYEITYKFFEYDYEQYDDLLWMERDFITEFKPWCNRVRKPVRTATERYLNGGW